MAHEESAVADLEVLRHVVTIIQKWKKMYGVPGVVHVSPAAYAAIQRTREARTPGWETAPLYLEELLVIEGVRVPVGSLYFTSDRPEGDHA